MNSAAIRGGTAPEATLNAVLLYDDFIVAAQANGALKRSTHLLDEAMQLNVKPWRLDMLKLPPTAAEALAEAADAHLIVLALGQSEYLPAWLMNWLEQWARHRQVHVIENAARSHVPAGTRNARNACCNVDALALTVVFRKRSALLWLKKWPNNVKA